MDGRTATLIVRYKATDGTWKRATAARGANGRIKPGHALIGGKVVPVEGYRYQVRYYVDRSVRYESAGTNANEAEIQRRRIEAQHSVKAEAARVGVQVVETEDRKTLKRSAADYIDDAVKRGASEAAAQARAVTEGFIRATRKTYIVEVNRGDVLHYLQALRKAGNGDRTVANKFARLVSWLRFAGMSKDELPPKPKYEKKLPTVYTTDEISSILGAADPYMHLAISIALKCGLRDQELIHLEWSDIDTDAKVLKIRGKAKWGFKVKDSEQREVPLPDDLLEELTAWKADHHAGSLILPTERNRPNGHMLRTLKRLAGREGLGCGHCDRCRGKSKECENWTLHKFRRTFATTLLRDGVDLRTVQALMGHADLASTMRYLRPAAGDTLRDKLNAIKW